MTGSGPVVILSNNGDETVRAVNALLAQGNAVGMVTEGENKGDFVVSYNTFASVAKDYVLVATRVAAAVAPCLSQPTLFLTGRYADFGDDKVSSGYYTQWFGDGYGFVNYDNILTTVPLTTTSWSMTSSWASRLPRTLLRPM